MRNARVYDLLLNVRYAFHRAQRRCELRRFLHVELQHAVGLRAANQMLHRVVRNNSAAINDHETRADVCEFF
ncbi:hypothetical protein SDC9_124348 [bioreactor metagenome]|uniref:Uncharacterized protein n=1 Tax=bioreactor metagenome TaxID=1076179 RepID=A0A645CK83_9ZZZZ